MNNLPKITIITTVKNGGKTLEKSIQSLISQNYSNLEFIILDGASSDNTVDIIKKYQKFIHFWRSKNDTSNILAQKEGIKLATGEIIAFLNADDFYEPEIFTIVAHEFQANPKLEILSFCYRTLKKDNNTYSIIDQSTPKRMQLDQNSIPESYGINARFFKKNLFDEEIIAFDNKGRNFISSDVEYMIRFILKGVNNKIIDKIGYNYLSHENSLTFSKSPTTIDRLYEDKIFIAKKFLNSNRNLPKIWQKTFKKWIKKYRAFLVISQLKQKNFREAKIEYLQGVTDNDFFNFTFYCLKSYLRTNL